jgi:hypothetical protein
MEKFNLLDEKITLEKAKHICTNISYYEFEKFTKEWHVNKNLGKSLEILTTKQNTPNKTTTNNDANPDPHPDANPDPNPDANPDPNPSTNKRSMTILHLPHRQFCIFV